MKRYMLGVTLVTPFVFALDGFWLGCCVLIVIYLMLVLVNSVIGD